MDTKSQKYILLNDSIGEYLDKGWLLVKAIPTQLIRGEIFEALPESEQTEEPGKIALICISTQSQNIKLVCPTLDVSELTDLETDLLAAVRLTKERFRCFQQKNRLKEAKSLENGCLVFVKPSANPLKEYRGVIWYIGSLPTFNGTMFGVELLDKESMGQGTTDGTFENKKYFLCPQDQGIFVAMDKLRPTPQDQDEVPKKETTILSTIKDMMPSFMSRNDSHIRVIAKDHKIKIDQRVVVFPEDDDHDKAPLRGIVRYISETIDSHGDYPVGIELDNRKGSGTGTGMFKGKQHFLCKKGYALFVPVTTLILEEDFDGATTEDSQNASSSETDGLCSSLGTLGYNDEAERRLSSSEQRLLELEESSAVERQAREETGIRLCSSEQRSHDLELQLHTSEQRSHEPELSLGTERQAREETETRLRSFEQRSHELELSLDTERQAREETETRLRSFEQTSHELELSLGTERQAREETETRLRSFEQRSHELELSLGTERQAREETETRLRSLEQRSRDLEASLTTERQSHEEIVRRLRTNAPRLEDLEISLAEKTQALQETERCLQSSEEGSHELENTLNTVRQAYETCRRSRSRESTQDWVLLRDEIRLSDKVIGIGAWGEVKEGAFRGCKVAVKKIHHLILSSHNRTLFEREMNMASRFRHPCLLQFIGATNDDQSPLFVTELLDTSLRAVLHDRPLEPPEITTIALDVAKGLNYLHLNHPTPIIHRDISSANVLLWKRVNSWRAKVSDFGTASFLQQSMTVAPGAVVYSAPEAQTSRQSPKLDVYSFGVLLCEMIAGEMPDVEQRNEQIAMVSNNFFRNLIRRCLKQNPEERPSMAEIIETLGNFPQ